MTSLLPKSWKRRKPLKNVITVNVSQPIDVAALVRLINQYNAGQARR